jgi:UDP-glucose 4-epimerase
MRYLVTGGAGFIGSNLVEALVEQGAEVRVLDNLSTGKEDNLNHLKDIELITESLANLRMVQQAMVDVDYVLHQGALPSVPKSVRHPLKTHVTNVDGTLNVLLAARDAGVKRVVYAASSSAYGNSEHMPKAEGHQACPRSPYAVQKYTGELYCRVFYETYGLETVALRYFNVFGPRQDPTSQYSAVIPAFVKAIMEGRQPTIFGSGEKSRDFTHVDNVVMANLKACTAPADLCAGEVFNIACGGRVTLNELVAAINQLAGTDIGPVYADPRSGDVDHSQASIEKAQTCLGYLPAVSFQEGLKQTFEWYRSA